MRDPFMAAQVAAFDRLIIAIMLREDSLIMKDGRYKTAPPVPPCPASIGNDPCDDWSQDDEDYD